MPEILWLTVMWNSRETVWYISDPWIVKPLRSMYGGYQIGTFRSNSNRSALFVPVEDFPKWQLPRGLAIQDRITTDEWFNNKKNY